MASHSDRRTWRARELVTDSFFALAARNARDHADALKHGKIEVIQVDACPACGSDTMSEVGRPVSSRCVHCGWTAHESVL